MTTCCCIVLTELFSIVTFRTPASCYEHENRRSGCICYQRPRQAASNATRSVEGRRSCRRADHSIEWREDQPRPPWSVRHSLSSGYMRSTESSEHAVYREDDQRRPVRPWCCDVWPWEVPERRPHRAYRGLPDRSNGREAA